MYITGNIELCRVYHIQPEMSRMMESSRCNRKSVMWVLHTDIATVTGWMMQACNVNGGGGGEYYCFNAYELIL